MAGEAGAERIILGVDPGTAATGYGVVRRNGTDRFSLLECGVIRTDSDESLARRIRVIHEEIREIIGRFEPAVVSVEMVYQGRNARSALTLGHTRGAILLAASLEDVEIAEYTASEIKSAVVGSGRASKDQVAFMVKEQLRLKEPPSPSDAADGVAAALCHLRTGHLKR